MVFTIRYSINWILFVMEERWVICEVGTVVLNTTYMNLGCKLVPLHKVCMYVCMYVCIYYYYYYLLTCLLACFLAYLMTYSLTYLLTY